MHGKDALKSRRKNRLRLGIPALIEAKPHRNTSSARPLKSTVRLEKQAVRHQYVQPPAHAQRARLVALESLGGLEPGHLELIELLLLLSDLGLLRTKRGVVSRVDVIHAGLERVQLFAARLHLALKG